MSWGVDESEIITHLGLTYNDLVPSNVKYVVISYVKPTISKYMDWGKNHGH